ncbi:MAG: HlyD family efflux transporter periplasmic adaptor subunit [Actinomycetia bacterium]|nr:HlyD family efflux transporter periplasmic adaptor subunit [Actinomycetes bacterium]
MAEQNIQPAPDQTLAMPQPAVARKKNRRGVVIGVLIGLVILGVLVAIFFLVRNANTPSASSYLTAQVQQGDLEKTISGSGQLKAGSTAQVNAQVSGTVTGLTVKLGDTVTKGQVLFTIDDSGTLAAAVTSASNSLESAQLSLTAAQQSLASAEAASVTTAQDLMASGSSSSSSSSGSGSSSQRSSQQQQQQQQQQPSSTSTPLTLAQAQAQADQANAQRASQIASAQAQVKQAQAQVTSAQSNYDTAVANQGKTTVTAPAAGVITALGVANGSAVSGSNNANNNGSASAYSGQGGNNSNANSSSSNAASSSTAAVEISDYSAAMTADISVSESDISSVKMGQQVRLSFTAFPSLDTTGVVTQISPTGTSSGSLVDFTVQMTLTKPDKQLRPGMSVTAQIVTASAANVLMVPNTAIDQASDGSYTVQVARGGNTNDLNTVTITIGIANDSYTEVKSGLSAGDVVISGTSAATSTSTSGGGGGLFGGMGGGGTMRTFRNDSGGSRNPGGGSAGPSIQGGGPAGGF